MKTAILLCVLVLSLATLATAQKRKHQASTKPDPPPVPQGPVPLQAPTLEQMPAQPPHVTYQNGLLSISADNSNLGDVLRAVRNSMGIGLDTPPGAGSERVVAHLGPGQPRDVLTQFFAGSKFDYILVGTAQDPNSVSQVILSTRQNSSVAANTPQPPPMQPANSMNADDDSDNSDDSQPEPTAAPQLPQQPEQQAGAPYQRNPYQNANPPSAEGGGETGPNRVKTPEQLLQELQRMQQQQQQQQQQNRPQQQ